MVEGLFPRAGKGWIMVVLFRHIYILILLQVRNSEDLRLITKVTNATPHFVATGLDSGTAYTLHVSVHSPMGASAPIKLEAFTVKTAEKRMGK